MTILIISGIAINIMLVILLLAKRKKSTPDKMLLLLIWLYAINMVLAYMEIYNRQHAYPYSFLLNTSVPGLLLVGPAIWFYVKSLTTQHFRAKPLYLLHFIPFLLVMVLFTIHFFSLPHLAKIEIDVNQSFKNNYLFPLVVGMIAISTQTYYIWALMLIRQYLKSIRNYFSDTHTIDLKWLRFLFISAIVFHGIISLLYIIDYIFKFFPYHLLQGIGYSFASLFICIIGFYGIRQGNIFNELQVSIDLSSPEKTPLKLQNLQAIESDFVNTLLLHMKNNKPYLNPDLTIANLSEELNQPVEFVSGILNGCLNQTFFDFVNFYRVEEFKVQCKNMANQKLSILGMANNCGFNSKTAFYRAFNKYEGITPKAYINRVL